MMFRIKFTTNEQPAGQKIATQRQGMSESLFVAIFLSNFPAIKPFKNLFRKFLIRYRQTVGGSANFKLMCLDLTAKNNDLTT